MDGERSASADLAKLKKKMIRQNPYQLNLVVDSSTAARCSALDTALDFNLGTMAPVCTAGAALWRPAAATRP